jgi:putative DNA primase/helicase
MLQALNLPPEEFLRPFFDANETVCLRVFDDKKRGVFTGAKLECAAGKLGTVLETLRDHNAKGRGVYFVVNAGGHEDAQITRVNAQFMECDALSFDEQEAQIAAFALPPSLIVRTAKSLHCYWLMKDAEVARFRDVQKQLVLQFHGDPACINESRVLRLPGFNHCKGESVPVRCVKFNPELRYTQAALSAALPPLPNAQPAVPAPKGSRAGLALVGRRCDFIRHCRDNAARLSEHDWYAMVTNLAVFEGGDRSIHVLSRSYPGYSPGETSEKIRHFLSGGTKPMTCAKIAESGFRCPRLEDGSCPCKAPAALCYQPLGVEELRAELANCAVSGSALENIQTAKGFIEQFLYNADPTLADAFLAYEAKAHFGFRAGDMKHLLAAYRELHKKYADSKETRRETEGAELPDWYEPTERGGLRFLPGILADHMAREVKAFYGAGSYFFYREGVYEMQEDLAAQAAARGFMIPRCTTMNQIADAAGQWRMQIRKPVREINANPFIVNLRNGLYNVLDGSFKPHDPAYFSTVQLSAAYQLGAECPQFLDFLAGILPESELPLMQEIFGYLLIPVNKAQKSFVFVGAPNAGKSTLLSIAQEILLGAENVSNIPWQSLGDRFNKAELFGKLANIFADLPSKSIDDGGMFKALTGEDFITAERKNKDPFSFRPYARLLFSCNDIPKNYSDRSDGFYRRLIIVRFDRPVPKNRRDPNLRERIAVERDGILLWALEGLKRLIDNTYQFSETERTAAELQRYKVESNSALLFLEECCELAEGAQCVREDLFERYRDYCGRNGFKPLSQTNFNRDVEASDSRITRARDHMGSRHTWRGLHLIDA